MVSGRGGEAARGRKATDFMGVDINLGDPVMDPLDPAEESFVTWQRAYQYDEE